MAKHEQLRRCLRKPDTWVASEVIALVYEVGISEALPQLDDGELDSLVNHVEQLDSDTGHTQWHVTPNGPVEGTVVPEGFADLLRAAIKRRLGRRS